MSNPLHALPQDLMPGSSMDWSSIELYQRTIALITQRAIIDFLQWARASEKTLEGVKFLVGIQNETNNFKWFATGESRALLEEGKPSEKAAPVACLNALTQMMNKWRNGPEQAFAKHLYELMSRADWKLSKTKDILPRVAHASFEGGEQWLRGYWAQEAAQEIDNQTLAISPTSSQRPRI